MKYYDIKEKLKDLVVFSPGDVYMVDPDFRLPTLYDWESKGLVIKLRNNNYVFGDFEPTDKYPYFIANKLYEPSYVSLESALSYYSIIPEGVQKVTSVTTNKTNTFNTPKGSYIYSSIDTKLYFGYKPVEYKSQNYVIATLEKALLDYLYLNTHINEPEVFDSLRWNKSIISKNMDFDLFDNYLVVFDNKSLQERCFYLMEYLDA